MPAPKNRPIWVYASHTDGRVDEITRELLGKGRNLGELANAALEAIIIGDKVEALTEQLLEYGACKVYYVEDPRLQTFCSSCHTHVVAELIKKHQPDVFLASCESPYSALAARVAARLGAGLSAHCTDLKFDGKNLIQTVPGFGGNLMANIVCPSARPQMATVAAGVFAAVKGMASGAEVVQETIKIPDDLRGPVQIELRQVPTAQDLPLDEAKIVVTGGFGVGSKENWTQVEKLAQLLHGAVGATRPPIDEGWAQAEQMIGASGIIISPELCFSLGVSGMMHHTVGIHGAKTIVAINSDPTAAIFSMADYGIVGDLKEVVPALIKAIETGAGLRAKLKPVGHTRTPEAYRESLRKLRPNMYKFGQLITDPVSDPLTSRTVAGHAQIFAAARDPEHQESMSTISHLTGKRVSRYLSVISSAEDMYANSKMKRTMFNLTGTCTGGRCAGWNAFNAMWSTSYDIDQDLGTDYHQRLKTWLEGAQKADITISGALTDPKGHRRLPPSRQSDPDMYLRVAERRSDGIVVRGAKIMICGTAAANELFILPGGRLRQSEADYAISFAIPKDAEGITIVEARHPSDRRELEPGFDNPVVQGGITQAYILFEDVFVPHERVFMCGEYSYAETVISRFTLPYRSAIGACVAGQGDLMIGAAILIARANGLAEKVFRAKLTEMMINNETTFAVGLGAAAMGTQHPSGCWFPNPVLANVNKVHVGTLPYDTKRITQDIAGGIAETGCMPSYQDFTDERYGHLLQKYLKAHSPAETRARIARLIEWLTIGSGVPGCMHGGGSPDGAKLTVWAESDKDKMIEMAKRIGNIADISLT